MRRGLPAVEGAACVRIDTRSLDTDEELPALLSIAELGDGPCGLERSVMFRKGDEQLLIWDRGAARRPGNMTRLPAKHPFHESP